MVSPKWIIFLLMMTVVLTLVNSTVEGVYFGGGMTNVFSQMLGTGVETGDRLSAFWKIVSFDYAMFENEYVLFRYIFGAIGIGTLFAILLGIVSGAVGLIKQIL